MRVNDATLLRVRQTEQPLPTRPGESFDPEVLAQANELHRDAMRYIRLHRLAVIGKFAAVSYRLFAKEGNPTFQVSLARDGLLRYMANPEFVLALDRGVPDVAFAVAHEYYHVDYRHLFTTRKERDELARWRKQLAEDPDDEQLQQLVQQRETWLKLHMMAEEALINFRLCRKLYTTMPTAYDGKVGFVEPEKLFRKCRKQAQDAGLPWPGKIDEFLESTATARDWMLTLPEPPQMQQQACVHLPMKGPGMGQHDGNLPDFQQDSGVPAGTGEGEPIDGDELDKVARGVYQSLEKEATQGGNEAARQELIERSKMAPDHPLAGRFSALDDSAPQVPVKGPEDWWKALVPDRIKSISRKAKRPRYHRTLGVWGRREMSQLGIPYDPRVGVPLVFRGKRNVPHVAFFGDLSGSVPDAFWEEFHPLVGDMDHELVAEWFGFDTELVRGRPGIDVWHGGGTSFDQIERFCNGRYTVTDQESGESQPLTSEVSNRYPDAVVVITDGIAQPISPRHPERWLWLILPHGSPASPTWEDWPLKRNMKTMFLPGKFLGQR